MVTTKSRKPEDIFAARLQELRQQDGYSIERFAETFKSKPNTVREWLNANVFPRAEALLAIAAHFGVTIDWLLGVEGAPKHPNQVRADATLADEVAAHVSRRGFAKAGAMPPWIRAELAGMVRGERLLDLLVDMAAEEAASMARAHREYVTLMGARLIFATKRDAIVRAVGKQAARTLSVALSTPIGGLPDAKIFVFDEPVVPAPTKRKRNAKK